MSNEILIIEFLDNDSKSKEKIISEQNEPMCSTCPDTIKTCDNCVKCDKQ